MPRKVESDDDLEDDPSHTINPYTILGLDQTATPIQIKSSYRRAALKHHPDKVTDPTQKEAAHTQFQDIALAYAILSDERRRKRYDTTGNTAESLDLDDDDFSWTDFFREQKAAFVDNASIARIKKEYQGSEEEKDDVLTAYEGFGGDMDAVYESVMLSDVLVDDARFRSIIDEAIKDGRIEAYRKYIKDSTASRKKRVAAAKKEESEAMAIAEEMGIAEKLYGKENTIKGEKMKTTTKKKAASSNEDGLKALIQQRQAGRAENFFDNLEAKYGGPPKKGKKRMEMEEPPEEAFKANAKKGKK